MATMNDVAKYARVSKMTVSRVLSGNGYVKEETRQAVLDAVQALNYRPNLLAKSLATGRSGIIAYVLPDICDPFFGNVCKGTTDVCEEMGYSAVVTNAANADSVDNFLNTMIDRKVDGVILHHLNITAEQLQILRDYGIHTVLIDNESPLPGAVNISNDNYNGACLAAEHLIAGGHRRIALVRGSLPEELDKPGGLSYIETFQKRIWNDRTAGFLDTLHRHGLEPFGVYHGRGSASMEQAFLSGQQIMKQILARPELPDAIYCESDLLALGVLGEMLETRIDCPGTVALCGHDGLDTCRFLYPRVTTVAQPQYEIGRLAATTLIRAIEGETPQDATVCSTLFVGDTAP